MIRSSMARAAFLLLLLIPLAGMGADEDVAWIADKNGCKVANPFPQPGESISWSGACKNGVADGDGLLQWYIDGKAADRYEGALREGWAEGKGTLTRAEGGRYSGDWKHSLQDGNGRYEATDGSWYEGQWKQGQPHGHGQYRTPDGRTVVGEWVNGVFEGDMDDDDNPNKT
jgi:hypothetical protein